MSKKGIGKLGLIISIVLILVAFSLSIACAPKSAGEMVERGKTIKVGIFTEFTGPLATEGPILAKASMDYITQLNEEEGGIARF